MLCVYGYNYNLNNILKFSFSSMHDDELVVKQNYNKQIEKFLVLKDITWNMPKFINYVSFSNYAPRFSNTIKKYFVPNSITLEKRLSSDYFIQFLKQFTNKEKDYRLAEIIIKLVIINAQKQYYEGTSSEYLGIAFMNYQDHFVAEDFFELMYHQLIHTLVFIDDILTTQLSNSKKTFKVTTNLPHRGGGNDFRLYVLFHSYLVGVEILHYRIQNNSLDFIGNYHGNTRKVINKTKGVREAFMGLESQFTPHGQQIIADYDKTFKDFINQINVG